MAKNKIGTCYLCGQTTYVTDDHVPPNFLSPKSPRSDFMFAPACRHCNNKYSTQEEIFRDFIVAGHADSPLPSAKDAQAKMLRSFQHGKPLFKPDWIHPSKLRLLRQSSLVEMYSDGGIYLGDAVKITAPKEAGVSKLLEKIGRGLQFIHFGSYLDESNVLEAEFYPTSAIALNPDVFTESISSMTIQGGCSDFFKYAGGSAEEDGKIIGMWICMIYDSLLFSVSINIEYGNSHTNTRRA